VTVSAPRLAALRRPVLPALVALLAASVATPAVVAATAGEGVAGTAPAGSQTFERRLSAMGTELTVTVEAAGRAAALAASERAVRAIEAAEARLSTWRPKSELQRLNEAPVGEAVVLSPALAADLAAAEACRRRTGGAFDAGLGALARAWGLGRGGRVPSDEEVRRARAASGMRLLDLAPPPGSGAGVWGTWLGGAAPAAGDRPSTDPPSAYPSDPVPTATRRAAGLILDAGGFGKGAGLAAAVAALQPSVGAADDGISGAVLDLGGQVALVGAPAAGGGWTVAVADPRRRQREVVALTVDGGSLATSGNGERGFEVDGRRYGHILDPASGRPAPDFGSLTVWAADPQVADCLSTGLYVLGPRRAFALAAADPSIEMLVVEVLDGAGGAAAAGAVAGPGLRVRATERLARHAVALLPGLVVESVPARGPAAEEGVRAAPD